jgi:hypothetical protein
MWKKVNFRIPAFIWKDCGKLEKSWVRVVGLKDLNCDLPRVRTSHDHVTMMIGNFKGIFHACGAEVRSNCNFICFNTYWLSESNFLDPTSHRTAYPGLQFRISTYAFSRVFLYTLQLHQHTIQSPSLADTKRRVCEGIDFIGSAFQHSIKGMHNDLSLLFLRPRLLVLEDVFFRVSWDTTHEAKSGIRHCTPLSWEKWKKKTGFPQPTGSFLTLLAWWFVDLLLELSSSSSLPFLLDIERSHEFTEDYSQCPRLQESNVRRHLDQNNGYFTRRILSSGI